MSECPTWDGELLTLIDARQRLMDAALEVARHAVGTGHMATSQTYEQLTLAARQLVAADDAVEAKKAAISRWLGEVNAPRSRP